MSAQDRFKEPDYFEGKPGARLPVEGKRNILITSALPYVNNVPHLGNIIGAVLSADVFSRYCRMRGYQSLYICGTDEYGTATEMKALTEGVSPQEICDKYYGLHKEVYEWFGIDFDQFGRTTTEHQTEIAQNIFLKIHQNGYTSVDKQKQLHCGSCEKFLADRFVSGTCPHCKFTDARGDQCDGCGRLLDGIDLVEPKCLICGSKPTVQESKHVFLNLDQLSPQIESYLNEVLEAKDSRWSSSAVAITRSWLKMGLEKRCITRDLKWGTPVPLEEFANKVFYVWFDAPIGYLSITKSLLGPDWTRWWMNPGQVELFHFLGKDNVAFHSIIFPATLLATKELFTRAKHICATEYLNYEDQKFSKSRGVGVFGDAVAKIGIPADVFRFYLLYMRPEGQDTSFCWDDLMLKVNSELLANLGNFVLRALSFLANSFGGVQPKIECGPVEEELFAGVDSDLAEYTQAMEEIRLRDALQRILAISRRGNQYMQAGQPWVLVKGSEEEKKRAQTIIGVSANLSLLLSTLLYPFMPTVSAQIREQCNLPLPIALPSKFMLYLKSGHKHNKPFPLFTKLEPTKIAEWKTLFGGPTQIAPAALANGTIPTGTGKATKSPVKSKKQQQQKVKMAAELVENNHSEQTADMDVASLYAQVVAKYQKAKEIFIARELVRLDDENAELRKQIESYKTKLGYADPMFNPPKAAPTVVTASAAASAAAATTTTRVSKNAIDFDDALNAALGTPATLNEVVPETPIAKQPKSKPKEDSAKVEAKGKQPAAEKSGKSKKGGGDGGAAAKSEGATANSGGSDAIDVGRLDLRVGRILEAKKHPDADALYVEQIDLGEEKPRTVVSGLVRFVPVEEMQNRLVVCLCNLKPAKMRGIESQAMVMCASTPEKVEILELDPACQPGDIVTCESFPHRPDQPFMNPKKKIWEDLAVSVDGECVYKGHLLRVQRTSCSLKAPTLRNVPVK